MLRLDGYFLWIPGGRAYRGFLLLFGCSRGSSAGNSTEDVSSSSVGGIKSKCSTNRLSGLNLANSAFVLKDMAIGKEKVKKSERKETLDYSILYFQ